MSDVKKRVEENTRLVRKIMGCRPLFPLEPMLDKVIYECMCKVWRNEIIKSLRYNLTLYLSNLISREEYDVLIYNVMHEIITFVNTTTPPPSRRISNTIRQLSCFFFKCSWTSLYNSK